MYLYSYARKFARQRQLKLISMTFDERKMSARTLSELLTSCKISFGLSSVVQMPENIDMIAADFDPQMITKTLTSVIL